MVSYQDSSCTDSINNSIIRYNIAGIIIFDSYINFRGEINTCNYNFVLTHAEVYFIAHGHSRAVGCMYELQSYM